MSMSSGSGCQPKSSKRGMTGAGVRSPAACSPTAVRAAGARRLTSAIGASVADAAPPTGPSRACGNRGLARQILEGGATPWDSRHSRERPRRGLGGAWPPRHGQRGHSGGQARCGVPGSVSAPLSSPSLSSTGHTLNSLPEVRLPTPQRSRHARRSSIRSICRQVERHAKVEAKGRAAATRGGGTRGRRATCHGSSVAGRCPARIAR